LKAARLPSAHASLAGTKFHKTHCYFRSYIDSKAASYLIMKKTQRKEGLHED